MGSVGEKHGLVRKIPNEMSSQKRPTVSSNFFTVEINLKKVSCQDMEMPT